ncbi:hypothetical protein SDC9_149805 [bioreactor metagenome]|uniref:Uncharacterized protein n=1 Tax=bioreactor metagenome TaxID=1076179 RepID=A0A645EN85_9ZZZZ
MAADHFLPADAQNLRHVGQILTVVMHGDFNQHVAAFHLRIQLARCDLVDDLRGRCGRRAEVHQNGLRGRNQLLHTMNRCALQRCQQRQRVVQIGKFHHQRVAVDGQKAHGVFLNLH